MTAGATLGCFDVLRGPIPWRPFGRDVFDAAAIAGTPVFLVIGAAWCPYSQRLLHWLHGEPEAVSSLTDTWLPVLVDADLRPDVHAAYNAGGWPTIALLDPRGDPVWRGTHVPRDRIAGFPHAMAPVAAAGAAPTRVDVTFLEPEHGLIDAIRASLEGEAGGVVGTDPAPRFPHLEAIEMLLEGDEADQTLGLASLRARLVHLWDTQEGGLRRQASGPGWTGVHGAKLLTDQAAWISALATAVNLTAAADLRAALRAAVDWCDMSLGDAPPGFAASIRPDHPDVSASWPVPRVDRRRFVDGNALMASALLKAAAALDADAVRRRALSLLDAMTLSQGGDCVFVRRGPEDDAALLLALAAAMDHDGSDRWRERAHTLADACTARQRDPRAPAAAAPRAGEPARMQRLPTDLPAAAAFAEALHRVAGGDAARRRRARRALQALTPAARLAGLAGARVALARRRLGLPDA